MTETSWSEELPEYWGLTFLQMGGNFASVGSTSSRSSSQPRVFLMLHPCACLNSAYAHSPFLLGEILRIKQISVCMLLLDSRRCREHSVSTGHTLLRCNPTSSAMVGHADAESSLAPMHQGLADRFRPLRIVTSAILPSASVGSWTCTLRGLFVR